MDFDPVLDAARKLVDDGTTPACQVAVAHDGEIICFETFGAATNDTRFCVFSATKPIVASAMWILIGEGLLDPSRPVAHYVPEFATNGKESRHRRAGAAAHLGLPERADGRGRGRRHGDARQALHRVAPRVGAGIALRVPRASPRTGCSPS